MLKRNSRTILCLLLTMFSHHCFPQLKSFTLSIHIKNIGSSTLEIGFLGENKKNQESIKITKLGNDNYVITGTLDYPCAARIDIKNRRASKYFYLDYGNQRINTDFDSLRNVIYVEGSKVNDEYIKKFLVAFSYYKKKDEEWVTAHRMLYKRYSGIIPVGVEDSMTTIDKGNSEIRDSVIKNYAISNPKSYVSFWVLYEYFYRYGYSKYYDIGFTGLNKKIQSTFDGINMKNRLINSKQLLVGNRFPSMLLKDTLESGKSLSSFLSKYTLVDFWYSHCSPCIGQFEQLKAIHKNFFLKGFEIIGISTDTRRYQLDWKKVIAEYKLPWVQLWDINGELAKSLSINAFPTSYLLDKSGNIIEKDIDLLKLEKFLNDHLEAVE